MDKGPYGIPGSPGVSGIKMRDVPSPVRALRAVANGGSGDINLLAARAADDIERLEMLVRSMGGKPR